VRAAEEAGHDLSDVRFGLQEVDDSLMDARTKIHAFNRSDFDGAAKKGFDRAAEARQIVRSTLEEFRQRRVGFGVSTLIVTLVAALLYLKIREIDRRADLGADPPKP
jgi:hypothetical protein